MAIVTQPVLAESFAGGVTSATIPQTAGLPYQNLGTADGMLFDTVSIGSGQTMTYAVQSGVPCCQITTTTGNACYGMWTSSGLLTNAAAQEWFRIDLYMTANPSGTHQLADLTVSGSRAADIVVNAAGTLTFRNSAGTAIFTTTNSVPLNTWFRIEGYVTSSATVGQVELKLFPDRVTATPTETKTSTATQNTLGGIINQVRYGLGSGGIAGQSWLMTMCSVSVTGYIGGGAIVQQMACGAPTPSGFTVQSKPVGGTSLRLKVATDAGLTQNVTYVSAQTPDQYGYVKHVVTGLNPFTRYYCQLADTPPGGSEGLVGQVGTCKTLPTPGQPTSFKVAFASCVNTGDDPSPMAAINDWIAWQPDLAVFTGDYDYENHQPTDVPSQIGLYEVQTWFYGNEPLIRQAWGYYCRSNHDSYENTSTQNTDDYQNPSIVANITAAQELFPFGTLGDTVNNPVHSLCQSWVVGRVRFIMLDDRTLDRSLTANTDNGSKTMLGPTQLAWLQTQLLEPEPLKVIVTDTAWMGLLSGASGDLEDGKWWSYSTERAALISFMQANAFRVQGVMLWHGDTHGLGCTPGASNPYGGFPVYCAAPMRQTGGGFNTSTFTEFYSNAGGQCRQYGRVTFTDTGSQITVQFSGWDALNQVQQVSQTDTFTPEENVSLLTVAPTNLVAGGASPTDLTAALTASPLGSNTGILFQNTGREVVFVQTNATVGGTTVTSDIGTTVQGQAVPGVAGGTQPVSDIRMYGPYPAQYNRQDGTNNIEIDFGTPANVAGVVVLHLPGVA